MVRSCTSGTRVLEIRQGKRRQFSEIPEVIESMLGIVTLDTNLSIVETRCRRDRSIHFVSKK